MKGLKKERHHKKPANNGESSGETKMKDLKDEGKNMADLKHEGKKMANLKHENKQGKHKMADLEHESHKGDQKHHDKEHDRKKHHDKEHNKKHHDDDHKGGHKEHQRKDSGSFVAIWMFLSVGIIAIFTFFGLIVIGVRLCRRVRASCEAREGFQPLVETKCPPKLEV